MQLAHLKTSPVVVLGPLDLLEWPDGGFRLGRHHQFSLTKDPDHDVLKLDIFVLLGIDHRECSWHILKPPQ